MTISSEIQYFLIHVKSLENLTTLNSFFQLFKLTISLLIKLLISFFSFNWINEILYRFNTLPNQNLNPFLLSSLNLDSINSFQEHLLNPVFFSPLFNGFYNAIFLCLPLSISHLYSLKEGSINNNTKIITFLSTIFGLLSYSICLNIGIFKLLQQWVQFDSLIYLFSLSTILIIIYKNTELEETNFIFSNNISLSNTTNWKRNIIIPFGLSWLEQIIIYPYIHSIGEPLNNLYLYSTISDSVYFTLGMISGAFLGTILFVNLFQFLVKLIWNLRPINPRVWKENINIFFNVIILIFTFASFPYYTLDYLSTNNIGLHQKEKIIQKGISNYEQLVKNKEFFFTLANKELPSYDIQQTNTQVPIEEYLYRGEKDISDKRNRQNSMVSGTAKSFMFNILNKLGISLNTTETSEKQNIDQINEKISRYNGKSGKLLYSVPQRFKKYSTIETTDNPFSQNLLQSTFIDKSMLVPQDRINTKIKNKYYENPIYKFILKGDIFNFLLNQPRNQFIQNDDFNAIIERQKAIESYNNTLRMYKNLPYKNEFYDFFNGAKSFSNKIDSHQSKGSLRIVRRLFKIDLLDKSNKKILSYDQPLFIQKNDEQFQRNFIHEELKINEPNTLNLTKWEPVPVYFGWDDEKREYVITTRYLNELTEEKSNKNKSLFFTFFPKNLTNKNSYIHNPSNLLSLPNTDRHYEAIKTTIEKQQNQNITNYETLPTPTMSFQKSIIFTQPERGVFLWSK